MKDWLRQRTHFLQALSCLCPAQHWAMIGAAMERPMLCCETTPQKHRTVVTTGNTIALRESHLAPPIQYLVLLSSRRLTH